MRIAACIVFALLLIGADALRKRTGTEPQAPTLEQIEIIDIDVLTRFNSVASFTAADPSGVKSVYIELRVNDTTPVASASWTSSNGGADTEVAGSPMITYIGSYQTMVAPGYYWVYVTLCDSLNNCDTYEPADLEAIGFQEKAVIFEDDVMISCPSSPIQVLNSAGSVVCTLTVNSNPLPVISYAVSAALSVGGKVVATIYPDNGNWDDPDATATSITVSLTFPIPQYAANGTYNVSASATGPNYIYDYATSFFVVAPSLNDLNPPNLASISIPNVVVGTTTAADVVANIAATDDAAGVANISITAGDFGVGNWTNSNTVVGSDTSVNIAVHIAAGNAVFLTTRKVYDITVTLCDKTGKCRMWSTSDLQAAGMGSMLNVGPVDPNKNAATVTCGGPYDVSKGPVQVSCSYSVTFYTGIYTYTVFAERMAYNESDPVFSTQAVPGYYADPQGLQTVVTTTQIVKLPQYAPWGNYSVLATTYDSTLLKQIAATTMFVVSKTTNDMGPPTLTALSVPAVSISNLKDFKARVSATDDASGVAEIQVFLFSKGTTGVGSVNTTNAVKVSGAEIPIDMKIYNATDSVFFVVEVMLIDALGYKKYYSTTELGALGFQANVTISINPAPSTTDIAASVSVSFHTLIISLALVILSSFYLI